MLDVALGVAICDLKKYFMFHQCPEISSINPSSLRSKNLQKTNCY